ncbi:MAG: glycerophosphodiester phosphodiesterase, partial [Flavobacteriales bacterium]|nr:glycerophosphodiester phosphodiesterase [Flavobacteriales bacterium]
MDVVASGDGQLVVSHEPWMSHRICLDANGDSIPAEHERLLNIHAMSAADLVQFDCGSRPHPDFPQQERVAVSKPLLSHAVRTIEEHVI